MISTFEFVFFFNFVLVPLSTYITFQKVKGLNWSERVSDKGYIEKGKTKPTWGLSIVELHNAVKKGVKAYNIPTQTIDMVHFLKNMKDQKKQTRLLKKRLKSSEQNEKDFILIHFTQGEFTDS